MGHRSRFSSDALGTAGRARLVGILLLAVYAASPAPAPAKARAPVNPLDSLAVEYTKLILATGERDPGYVDAYYGPPEWQREAAQAKADLSTIRAGAGRLLSDLDSVPPPNNSLDGLRRRFLRRQTEALLGRLAMLAGKRLSFDEESRVLYDAVAPHFPESHFQELVAQVAALVPGGGPVNERVDAFQRRFTIPRDRLDAVFQAAIAGCRERTQQHLTLPPGESFVVEYVTGKPWSGYNWYQGNYHSIIQVNTDLPIFIDRAIDLACHEGYPGHHVYNSQLEQHLVRERGWVELSVYPLYSPQSLIAEGSANYGVKLAFPQAERVAFEKARLFPLAGLDPAQADRYYQLLALKEKLSYAGNEAARRYLDGEIKADAAVDWLARYSLQSVERARQRLQFIDTYRSYVINYNLGQDMVSEYVAAKSGGDRARQWQVFVELLSSPRLPSDLTMK
ncbi:MAG TPA: hypothetical protein VGV61_15575 [Thermoanaerobaculia bacterium]|jgi:hypothetical protein|nr:hypothetical protein [Thermoanaerobaculia bacterium]